MAWLPLPRACPDFPRAVQKGFGVPGFGRQGYNHTFGDHMKTGITCEHVSSPGSLNLPKRCRKQRRLFVAAGFVPILDVSGTWHHVSVLGETMLVVAFSEPF